MESFPAKRFILCVCAIAAVFFMPWPAAVALGIIAALYVPPIAAIIGLIFDFLYYTSGIPYCTISGIVIAIIAFFVHRFIKTRIIS